MTDTIDEEKSAGKRRTSMLARPKRNAPAPEAKIVAESVARAKSQRGRAGNLLLVGGSPTVDLLPTEVLSDRRQRANVRRAWFGVVAIAVATGLGIAGAGTVNLRSQSELLSAQSETSTLLAQQQQYANVRRTESAITLLQAGQTVGGSTEIDWSAYLQSVQESLPSGVAVTSVTVDSASPTEAYTQATGPLQGQRIATLTFEAASSELPSVPDWLNDVRTLKGFVDANAGSVTLTPSTGVYTVDMTVHLNEKAFDKKYTKASK